MAAIKLALRKIEKDIAPREANAFFRYNEC